MRELPPLSALRAFLAACQSDSFSDAAEKLSVTHGVISKQVQVAENWFGATLFQRKGNRRIPTPYALTLAQELTQALENISDIALRHRNGATTYPLRVSVPSSFCMHWLIPRLPRFYQQHPAIALRIDSATSEEQESDGRYDLVIRRRPSAEIPGAAPFYRDRTVLLAAPSLLQQYTLSTPADVLHCPRIETLSRPGCWAAWCRAAGIDNRPAAPVHRFDHFYVTTEAIRAGLGIGAGPAGMLRNLLQNAEIQIVFPGIFTDAFSYYALTPPGVQKTVAHRTFESWLISEGSAD